MAGMLIHTPFRAEGIVTLSLPTPTHPSH
ncbi:hypothetical protein ACNKHO_21375 [Shigella flexneri]